MARNELTERMIKQARKPCVLIDGKGLRLRVTANANTGQLRKSWLLRVTVKGGPVRELGLGSADDLALADARELASVWRKLAREGHDPIGVRAAERSARALAASRAQTFKQCAQAYVAAHKASWRSAKHAQQWTNTLDTYAYPVLGKLSVQAVDVSLVMRVLEPIWETKTETASRVRQRIESVLDWATVRGYRQGENPARWRGHLQKALPARAKVQKVQHHPALPYALLPSFMEDLGTVDSDGARALEFAILTATRTNETLRAHWSEFDLSAKTWTIPADRMKAGRPHRVPLSNAALAILKTMRTLHPKSEWVFAGAVKGKPLSNMALLMTLRRLERSDITAHGFRSTFRDWAAEQTSFARETAEAALAHAIGDKTEAAYRRGDALEKRRRLMDAWASYCNSHAAASTRVVPIRKAKR